MQSSRTVRGAVSRDGTDDWDSGDLRHYRIDRSAGHQCFVAGWWTQSNGSIIEGRGSGVRPGARCLAGAVRTDKGGLCGPRATEGGNNNN